MKEFVGAGLAPPAVTPALTISLDESVLEKIAAYDKQLQKAI